MKGSEKRTENARLFFQDRNQLAEVYISRLQKKERSKPSLVHSPYVDVRFSVLCVHVLASPLFFSIFGIHSKRDVAKTSKPLHGRLSLWLSPPRHSSPPTLFSFNWSIPTR